MCIRSYTSLDSNSIFKSNVINTFVSKSLTKYFVHLLGIFVLSLLSFSIKESKSLSVLFILEKLVQSWILLNGIVPFSIKLLLIVNRGIQSYLYTDDNIEYLDIGNAENFNFIDRMVCDKTGTITQNRLFLTHYSSDETVYLNENESINDKLSFESISNIVIALHVKDDIYNTEEDRVIGHKIISCGLIVSYKNNHIDITNDKNEINIEIIEMLN